MKYLTAFNQAIADFYNEIIFLNRHFCINRITSKIIFLGKKCENSKWHVFNKILLHQKYLKQADAKLKLFLVWTF